MINISSEPSPSISKNTEGWPTTSVIQYDGERCVIELIWPTGSRTSCIFCSPEFHVKRDKEWAEEQLIRDDKRAKDIIRDQRIIAYVMGGMISIGIIVWGILMYNL